VIFSFCAEDGNVLKMFTVVNILANRINMRLNRKTKNLPVCSSAIEGRI
jgi:hypothetical protein